MQFETYTKRFTTRNENITKVIIGNMYPDGHMVARAIYYEVEKDGQKLPAIDYTSALTTLYEDNPQPSWHVTLKK